MYYNKPVVLFVVVVNFLSDRQLVLYFDVARVDQLREFVYLELNTFAIKRLRRYKPIFG